MPVGKLPLVGSNYFQNDDKYVKVLSNTFTHHFKFPI